MPSASQRPLPRERLLDAADELFYEEGICSVGIDRVLERAEAARASLYSTFGSKDELVRAYLQRRSDTWRATVAEVLPERWDDPPARILGIFTMLAEWFVAPGYRGCPFINASAESTSGDMVAEVRAAHRGWVRQLFAGLAEEAGADHPGALADQLVLLYDGAMVGAQLDGGRGPGEAAQSAAKALLDSEL